MILLAVTALLLQFGMGRTPHALDETSHPINSAAMVVHVLDCGDHDCLTHGCTPHQGCGTNGGAACHSPCAQTPLLAMSAAVFLASPPATADAGNTPGPGTRRLDTPFRPPA
jgi:hypothetical protein